MIRVWILLWRLSRTMTFLRIIALLASNSEDNWSCRSKTSMPSHAVLTGGVVSIATESTVPGLVYRLATSSTNPDAICRRSGMSKRKKSRENVNIMCCDAFKRKLSPCRTGMWFQGFDCYSVGLGGRQITAPKPQSEMKGSLYVLKKKFKKWHHNYGYEKDGRRY